MTVRRLLAVSFLMLSGIPALASGLIMPSQVKQSMGGSYIVRGQAVTNETVSKMRYGVFHTTKNKTIGDQVEGAILRPNTITTRAGTPRPFVAVVPGSVSPETPLALCLWKEDAEPTVSELSQLRVRFRFCRFFRLLPKRNPILSTTVIP